MIVYEPISRESLPGVIALLKVERWESYTKDPELTWKALRAPGVCTVVARDASRIVGFVQMLGDGYVANFLSLILVDRDYRRRGVARALVREAFKRAGGQRVDLVTDSADEFYRSFQHREFHGYRIYPEGLPKDSPT